MYCHVASRIDRVDTTIISRRSLAIKIYMCANLAYPSHARHRELVENRVWPRTRIFIEEEENHVSVLLSS